MSTPGTHPKQIRRHSLQPAQPEPRHARSCCWRLSAASAMMPDRWKMPTQGPRDVPPLPIGRAGDAGQLDGGTVLVAMLVAMLVLVLSIITYPVDIGPEVSAIPEIHQRRMELLLKCLGFSPTGSVCVKRLYEKNEFNEIIPTARDPLGQERCFRAVGGTHPPKDRNEIIPLMADRKPAARLSERTQPVTEQGFTKARPRATALSVGAPPAPFLTAAPKSAGTRRHGLELVEGWQWQDRMTS
jgi:hypothetical protein